MDMSILGKNVLLFLKKISIWAIDTRVAFMNQEIGSWEKRRW